MGRLDDLPEIVRFALSGAIGTLLDYLAYKLLYDANVFPYYRATLSWAVAYAISVVWQHTLHAMFVFGGFGPTGYCKSLFSMYIAYSGSILFSPVINWTLVEYGKLDHDHAWILTLMITGIVNYIVLSRSMAGSSPVVVILSGGVPIEMMRHESRKGGHTLPRHNSETNLAVSHKSTTVVIGGSRQSTCEIC
ncbi:hypothetical protein DIPPA_15989 [Diplonema papillatum]|nr:hypothetical protein DIPPA_15989 [Diplonema papillatum]